ncbi:hypothetical protein DV495_003533 [Geotrichum candidum]|nr:hypothetical protein DV452_001670 [Geotrichum candidum]KAF5126471.1 hypothetical protein DV495_003533 [Geotrichum candidum]
MLSAVRLSTRMLVAPTRRVFAAPTIRSSFAGALRFSSSNVITPGSAVTAYSSSEPIVKYTEDHEWIALHDDGIAFIGITKYAADALGDATYIELPNPGDVVEKGESIGSVESVKSASEIYSPVSCEIVEGNKDLEESAALINKDPQGDAWFAKIKVTEKDEIDELMNLEAYEEFIASH